MNEEVDTILRRDDKLPPGPLLTPLTRDLGKDVIEAGELVNIPDQNYSSYNLFVLRTRLRVLMRREWSSTISVNFSSQEYGGKMHIKVTPQVGDVPLELTNLQKAQMKLWIDEALADSLDYAVIVSDQDVITENGTRINGHWYLEMTRYVKNPFENNPVIFRYGKYGLEGRLVTGSTLNTIGDDYIFYYNQIASDLQDQILELHDQGVMINPPTEIITKWSLIPAPNIDFKYQLFIASWVDDRITRYQGSQRSFIQSRVEGSEEINVKVGVNAVDYHRISKKISDCYFVDTLLMVNVKDLREAQKVCDVIDDLDQSMGKVIVFKTERRYKSILRKIAWNLGIRDVVFYNKPAILGYDLYFSGMVNFDSSEQVWIHEIRKLLLAEIMKQQK